MKTNLLTAIYLIFVISTQGNSWIQKSDFGGTARQYSVGFSIGSKGYIGTGNDVNGERKDFWEYDPVIDAWTQKADFGGVAREFAAGFAIASKGYIGTGRDANNNKNDFWEYNPSTNSWLQKANFGGTPRFAACGFSIGIKGYIATGIDGTFRKDIWEYDPASDNWTQKTDFGGTARGIAIGFAIGNNGYIGTGFDMYGTTNDFWEFNPSANTWTQKANFGGSFRAGAIGFSIGNKGYAGTGTGILSGNYLNDFWEYDPIVDAWTQKANVGGLERNSAAGFSIGTKGYVGLGITSTGFTTNDFWEYNPITTGTIIPTTLCTGDPVSIPYTASGIFSPGNIFTAELSNSSGSFSAPVQLGSISSTTSGIINTAIPAGLVTGNSYRIRVVSTNPVNEGIDNGTNITITQLSTPLISIAISSGTNPSCSGSNITFIANPVNGGSTPFFQWKKNGIFVGLHLQTYSSNSLLQNDVITCEMTSTLTCVTAAMVTSNAITMTINPLITPSVNIVSSVGNSVVCSNETVTFTAAPVNGGTAPVYQWKQNGNIVGTNSSTYTNSFWNQNNPDSVSCLMTSNAACLSAASANSNRLFVYADNNVGNNWAQRSRFEDTARIGAVGFSIGNKGYFGTGDRNGSKKKDFWEYDPLTNLWTQKADFGGTARSDAVGFSIGNKGYLGTGYDTFFNNDLWEYDPAANTWVQKASLYFGGRYDAVGFSIGNKGYIGLGIGANNYFWEYDPVNDSWLQKANFIGFSRAGAVGFSIGNKGYIGTGSNGGNLNDFYEYDPLSNTWTIKSNYPVSCSEAVGFTMGNFGYLGTGVNTSGALSSFYRYDPSTNNWTQITSLNIPISEGVAFGIGSRGFVTSGIGNIVNTTWEYHPEGSFLQTTIANLNFCPGDSVNVDYTTGCYNFSSGNVFIAQLSDAYGSFANPVSIGSLSSTISGTISSVIPQGTTPGSGYRIRVESAFSLIIGTDNGTDLTINNTNSNSVSIAITSGSNPSCSGSSVTFTAIPVNGGTPTYQWKKNGNNTGTNNETYSDNSLLDNDIISCDMTSSLSCPDPSTSVSNSITMSVLPSVSPSINIVSNAGSNIICPNATVIFTASSSNGGLSPSYQWKVNGANAGTNSTTYSGSSWASGNTVTCSMTSNATCPVPATVTSNAITIYAESSGGNTWMNRGNFGGGGRMDAVGFSIGNKGYIGTGSFNSTYKKDFWEFDPVTNVWTQKADFGGTARIKAVGFSIGNKGYLGTGIDVAGNKNDFWEYNPSVNFWTQRPSIPSGSGNRYSAVGFSIGNKGYVGTGWSGSVLNDFWEFNPLTNSWTAKANFAGAARSQAVGMAIGNKGYIGTGQNLTGLQNDFWEYDPVANTWLQKANYPGGLTRDAAAFAIGSLGYVGTGWKTTYQNDFYSYDPSSNSWSTLTNFPVNVFEAVGFSIGGKGYIGTGDSGFDNPYLYEYNPTNTILHTSSVGTYYCAGVSIPVSFTIGCNSFSPGNIFTAQLSDNNGTFANPVNIGTVTATGSGSISAVIPAGTVSGTRYRIRVIGSIPSTIGTDNGTDFTINAANISSVSISVTSGSNPACSGSPVTFTAVPVNGGTPSYQWKKNGSNTGTNSAAYSDNTLQNNDVITCEMTSSMSCALPAVSTSNSITMTINSVAAPAVSISSSGNPTCPGTNVTFTASPTNGGTPSYQWKKNGINVGTNSNTYSDNTLLNNDVISCIMTSTLACASPAVVTSNSITMTVNAVVSPSVSISSNAAGNTICSGVSVTFTAVTTNGGSPSYQWKVNGTNIGTNSSSYTTSSLVNNDVITCVMASTLACASPATATSNSITMIVNAVATPSVSISSNAAENTICSGASVTYTAVPINGGTPSYQWKVNGANTGSNSSTFATNSLVNNNVITCVMTSTMVCASPAAVTSNNITMTVNAVVSPSVSISSNAPGNNICAGTSVTFTAVPTNGGTPSYQWKVNGVNAGTNSSSFTISSLANSDVISCTMTSTLSCVSPTTAASNSITMTVNAVSAPSVSISSNAPGNTICSGASVTFTAVPTNGGTPSYQWKINGANAGTNSSLFTASSIVNNDVITCLMSSSAPCASPNPVTSNSINMTVNPIVAPSVSISSNASGDTTCSGANMTFTAVPVNGGNPSYQWKVNGVNAGTNSSSYSTNTIINNDVIYCVMTTTEACVSLLTDTSNFITMTVLSVVTPSVSISSNAPANIACSGTMVVFTGVPSNGGTPAYQWKKNGNNVGTNSNIYSDNAINNLDVFTCVMTSSNSCASPPTVSSSLTMHISPTFTPSITISYSGTSTVCQGITKTFNVSSVNGGTSPSYQWKKNGINVGAPIGTYSDNTLVTNDVISCVLTSSLTCTTVNPVTSNSLTISVTPTVTPSVTISSSVTTICAGTSVGFTATPVNGGTIPSYQWKINGINAGSNSSNFNTNSLANGNAVTCIMTSSTSCASPSSATSNSIVMTVNPSFSPAVTITANPGPVICSGTSVTFTPAPVNGGTSPIYNWYKNNVLVATSNTYSSNSLVNFNSIFCVMSSNLACASPVSVQSNFIFMSITSNTPASVSINASPGTTLCQGAMINFSAIPVNGGTTPVYQWKKNGLNTGTNSAAYSDNNFQNGDQVSCEMTSNAVCPAPLTSNSNVLSLTINPTITPSIVITPNTGNSICIGTPIIFSASILNGGTSPQFQWKKNGNNVGANSSSYTDNLIQNNDIISCEMTSNVTGTCLGPLTVSSNSVILSVYTAMDDNNACTIDGCDPLSGPTHVPVNSDDGNICTNDGCDPFSGIYHNPAAEICGNGLDDDCDGSIDEGCTITLQLKFFIEGYYLGGGQMIPAIDMVNYPTLCDTANVILHDAVSPYNQAGSDKSTFDINGNCTLHFQNSTLGSSFYIEVRHRNAIATWSSTPVLFNAAAVSYDFTNAISKSFGNNMTALGDGNYGFWSGDISSSSTGLTGMQDDIIESQDYSDMENAVYLVLMGYLVEDITGDGLVESADYSIIENNVYFVILSLHP